MVHHRPHDELGSHKESQDRSQPDAGSGKTQDAHEMGLEGPSMPPTKARSIRGDGRGQGARSLCFGERWERGTGNLGAGGDGGEGRKTRWRKTSRSPEEGGLPYPAPVGPLDRR